MGEGRLDGKIALITGGARGQGRSHALCLAREGADVAIVDICRDIELIPYPLATDSDMDEAVASVRALGRRALGIRADIRDLVQLQQAVATTVTELGGVDIVCANANVLSIVSAREMTSAQWQTAIDIGLTGSWNTYKATIDQLLERGSGLLVFTLSGAAFEGFPSNAHYTAAKHGVLGLMRTLALEHAADGVRINCVSPTNCNTPMALNEMVFSAFRPDLSTPRAEDIAELAGINHAIPEPWIEPHDVSAAVLYLASPDGRDVNGAVLRIDLGRLVG